MRLFHADESGGPEKPLVGERFEDIISFLFERVPEGASPQMGFADKGKRALIWLPGRAHKPTGCTVDASQVKFLGCTNRAYREPYRAMDSQESWIVWAGLDIDADDNPGLTAHQLFTTVRSAIGSTPASIRSSCGGRGLHVFLRLAEPIWCPAFPAKGLHTSLTQQVSRDLRGRIEAAGVHVCKSDSRMFWLTGGENRWLHIDKGWATSGLTGSSIRRAEGAAAARVEQIGITHDAFVEGWLHRLGVRPGPIYVGDVVMRLRELGERVVTKSPCSGNGRVNGYIDVSPGRVSLWAHADGHEIWCAEDTDSLMLSLFGDSDD